MKYLVDEITQTRSYANFSLFGLYSGGVFPTKSAVLILSIFRKGPPCYFFYSKCRNNTCGIIPRFPIFIYTMYVIKTYRKWSAQIGFGTILQQFLVNFLQTTLISFTKLMFWWTFWGAKCVLILIGSKTMWQKTFFCFFVFFNFVRKKMKICDS